MQQDESGYDIVDKKKRSVSISTKNKKKKKGRFDMRKASSAEHLYESADFENDTPGMPKSATNSPLIPRRSPEHGNHAPGPTAGPAPSVAGAALPLPNQNFLPGPPNLDELKEGVNTSQLYAQVVASPKQPPKKTKDGKTRDKKSADSEAARLDVDQTKESGKMENDEGLLASVLAVMERTQDGESWRNDKNEEVDKDEQTQLVETSLDDKFGRVTASPERDVSNVEIEHTMEGDDAYAVVPAKTKKVAARKQKVKEMKAKAVKSNKGNGMEDNKGAGKLPPPKPPKSYLEHIAETQDRKVESETPSHPTTVSAPPRNFSPPPPSLPTVDISLGLTPQERTRVASFSSGPPSFPPPPPPTSTSPEPLGESMNEEVGESLGNTTNSATKKPKRKAPPRPEGKRLPSSRPQNGLLGENEPEYEVVKNDKRVVTGHKKDVPKTEKNGPGLVHIDKVSKPHLTPSQRSPHVYSTFEDVENEHGELKTKEGSITVPVKTPAAGYATVSHSKRATLPQPGTKDVRSPSGKLSKHPKLTPKTRPPPPPPGHRRSDDSTSSGSLISPHGQPLQMGADPLAEDQLGKRIYVSMENSPTQDSTGPEPKFLFSHAQKFIVVS